MKVLLVSMPFEGDGIMTGDKYEVQENESYCLGLGYLHSYLESKGHFVEIMALNYAVSRYETTETAILKVLGRILRQEMECVGINTLTFNRAGSFALIESLHKNCPDVKIVMGGIHPTIMYDQILKKYPYIVIVRGEGEHTFAELLDEWNKPEPNVKNIRGLALYDNTVNSLNVILTQPRPLIPNLDDLPFPNHKYFHESIRRTVANMMSSRGCPNRCSFCCLNPTGGTSVRFRSVKNTVDEIEYIERTFPDVNTIQFCDDAFFTRPSRVIEICNEIVKRGIKLNFVCQARAKPCTREMALAMQKAGFVVVTLGMETGDPGVLKGTHKNFTLDDIVQAYKIFKGTGIRIVAYEIVGLPGETHDTIINTGKFVQKLQKMLYEYYPLSNLAMVFPGTVLSRNMVKAGIITDDYWLTDNRTPVYTVDHSLEELERMQEDLMTWTSCDKLFTRKGFGKQWHMIPYIYWYKLCYFWIPRYITKKAVW